MQSRPIKWFQQWILDNKVEPKKAQRLFAQFYREHKLPHHYPTRATEDQQIDFMQWYNRKGWLGAKRNDQLEHELREVIKREGADAAMQTIKGLLLKIATENAAKTST